MKIVNFLTKLNRMKKIVTLLIVLLFVSLNLSAQKTKNREKIKALKVAFLTEKLNLDTQTAQKFWPVYNEHEENLNAIRKKGMSAIKDKLNKAGGFEGLNEEEAKLFVKNKIDFDEKELIEKKDFLAKVSKILSYKQILKLHLSEREFTRQLMRKYRKRRDHK